MAKRPQKMKFQVNHPHHSGGPKFSSLTEALRYIAFVMRDGETKFMTVSRITE